MRKACFILDFFGIGTALNHQTSKRTLRLRDGGSTSCTLFGSISPCQCLSMRLTGPHPRLCSSPRSTSTKMANMVLGSGIYMTKKTRRITERAANAPICSPNEGVSHCNALSVQLQTKSSLKRVHFFVVHFFV